MRGIVSLLVATICCSCVHQRTLDQDLLSDYILLNDSLEIGDLVACAGGRMMGLLENEAHPTDVFFYPIEGATDFRYFETVELSDSTDFRKYVFKELTHEPIFNGYLWKFNNTPFEGERLGIVTYRTPGKLHVCSYIRLKTNVKPTESNNDLGQVIPDGVTPTFTWEDGQIKENIIYFQVVSTEEGDLISGTYTTDKMFTFYDTSNVVFNITNPQFNPSLEPETNYQFTLMGVSEDNWVNLLIEKSFTTEE